MRVWANRDLIWNGLELRPRGRRKPIVQIAPDVKYPQMWRVVLSDGTQTDMVNLTRAKDAAKAAMLRLLNNQETAAQ